MKYKKIRKIDGYAFFAIRHFVGHFEIKKIQSQKVDFFFHELFSFAFFYICINFQTYISKSKSLVNKTK